MGLCSLNRTGELLETPYHPQSQEGSCISPSSKQRTRANCSNPDKTHWFNKCPPDSISDELWLPSSHLHSFKKKSWSDNVAATLDRQLQHSQECLQIPYLVWEMGAGGSGSSPFPGMWTCSRYHSNMHLTCFVKWGWIAELDPEFMKHLQQEYKLL